MRGTAWSKGYTRLGPIVGVQSITMVLRHNLPGEASIVVDADSVSVDDLAIAGARATLDYWWDDQSSVTPIRLSGPVEETTGQGVQASSVRTFHLVDDFADVMNRLVGWPNPTGTINEQGADTAYYTSSGAAETVVRDIVSVNATRAGIPLHVAATAGKGSSIKASIRMHPLYDRLFPAVEQAGIGVRVVQRGAQRELETYTPATYPLTIKEDSGIIVDGSFSITRPAVTRVVLGAGGEGTLRKFFTQVDTAAEAAWGISEASIDARDLDPSSPTVNTDAAQRMTEALTEGAAQTSLSVELTDTDVMRFGDTYQVGDKISVQLAGSPVLTDHVREVQITYTASSDSSGGVTVRPLVGAWSDESTLQDKTIAAIAKGVRDLQRSM